MLQAALNYAGYGYRVFPCLPGQKRPATARGLLDATTDQAQIEKWWEQTPAANVAIATDGLFVLDIDGKDNQFLADQPERALELAAGTVSLTPRGGRHIFFKQPAGKLLRNTAGKIAPAVDSRSGGGYVLAAPSIVNGVAYRWPNGALDVPPSSLPEPPSWLLDLLDSPGVASTSVRLTESQPANPIPDGQRNSTLTQLGGTMRRVGMNEAEIYAALAVANTGRCRPPLPDEEVRTIAWSVARYEPDGIAVSVAEGHWEQDCVEPISNGPADPGKFPEELLDVPGFIHDVTAYNLAGAFKPQPVLALAAALPLLGTLTGRKVADPFDTRTNLYCLGVCESGGGKERARQVNKEILYNSGLSKLAGSEGFASGTGVVNAVAQTRSVLFQLDEIGRILRALQNPKAAPHLASIVTVLMKLFTSSNSVYIGEAYADTAKNIEIPQPNASLYGTTVPQSLYEGLTAESITDGFLSRMMIFESANGDPDSQKPASGSVPQGIIDVARYWGSFQSGGNLSNDHPVPKAIAYTDAAETVMEQLEDLARFERRLLGQPFGTLWTRTTEKARKLALLFACSADHASPTVTHEAAIWGAKVSEYLTRRMIFLASCWIAENRQESDLKRVQRIIDAAPGGRIDKTGLLRATQWLGRRERDEILATLIESRSIGVDQEPTGRRPRTVYLAPGATATNS